MKICSRCKEVKDERDFYRDKRTPDGLKCQCKKCHTEGNVRTHNAEVKRNNNKLYMRRAVEANPEKFREQWRKRHRVDVDDEKKYARMALNAAVRSGNVVKPGNCSDCGGNYKLTAHHFNYDEPLIVEWLCYECHARKHRKDATYA